MFPFWSGKLKTIALGSTVGIAVDLVVKVLDGTTTGFPNVSRRPVTDTVYCVPAAKLERGAKESTVPECESTKGSRLTGVVPCVKTRFACATEAGSRGIVVVTVMIVLTGIPKLPLAGVIVAVVTVPARLRLRIAV